MSSVEQFNDLVKIQPLALGAALDPVSTGQPEKLPLKSSVVTLSCMIFFKPKELGLNSETDFTMKYGFRDDLMPTLSAFGISSRDTFALA
jgi:hypothetical protein